MYPHDATLTELSREFVNTLLQALARRATAEPMRTPEMFAEYREPCEEWPNPFQDPRDLQRYTTHAHRDAVQAAVMMVTTRYGDEAGEWLLAEFQAYVKPKE